MEEKKDTDKIISSYKQTNALLVVIGILLGSYTINGTGFNNLFASIVALLVVIYGSYKYYTMDGKIGIFLILAAILWVLGYVLMYLKII
jgi:hypothetical protein